MNGKKSLPLMNVHVLCVLDLKKRKKNYDPDTDQDFDFDKNFSQRYQIWWVSLIIKHYFFILNINVKCCF